MLDPEQRADLTDGVARGQLAAAELAAISPGELEALFELGAQRLDAQRNDEAVTLFAALVALFPFSPKYWRAYGVARHRVLDLEGARAAYDAALLLEPGHAETLCYRGEVLMLLGDYDGCVRDLEVAVASGRHDLQRRAQTVLGAIDALGGWAPPTPPRPAPVEEETTFTLRGGATLPLAEGRLASTAPDVASVTEEVTQTAQIFAPEVARLSDADALDQLASEPTAPGPLPQPASQTKTAPLRQERTETALIPGRAAAIERTPTVTQAAPLRREVTQTAIIRRRALLPLCDLDEEGDRDG